MYAQRICQEWLTQSLEMATFPLLFLIFVALHNKSSYFEKTSFVS